MSHYDVLGAARDADSDQLRRAFVAKARQFHPDRHVGAEPAVRREAERKMREVTEAWAVLGDPERRRRYDLGMSDSVARGRAGGPGGGGPPPGQARPAPSASAPRTGSGGPRTTGSASTVGSSSAGGRGPAADARDWRSYASPGAGGGGSKPVGEQLLLLSPVLLLFIAGLAGMGGAIIGWPPFFGLALVCLIGAAAAFFMLPIWAMTRRAGKPGRGVQGPKRSY